VNNISPKFPLPKAGKVLTYLLTSAQNNTKLHIQCWENLLAYAEHRKARVIVATYTYNKQSLGSRGAKRKTSKESKVDVEWWAPEIEPYVLDERTLIAPGLVWCGELQILPTSINPIAGLESYTGRQSSIFPHPKFAMQSVPSPATSGTKFLYTTGTVTLSNYIQKKAGQKAEFHHGYGALLVEVDSDGNWFARQLCASSDGSFYDLDIKVEKGAIKHNHRPEALIWGDIHERQLALDMRELCFGTNGILDTLKPRHQVMHDLLDFRSQNHHDREDSWLMFEKFRNSGLSVQKEIRDAEKFLHDATRHWCMTVVVCGNHDEAFIRWLKEADFRADPENALLFLRVTIAVYEAISLGAIPYPIDFVFQNTLADNVRFLQRDESFVVCPEAGGGVELGMHGDKGANGARGTLRTFAKTGRKCVVGHSHSAGWFEGATQVGVLGALDQGYNEGMSSWSHTNALVYLNGKRALFTIWNGKWRAE